MKVKPVPPSPIDPAALRANAAKVGALMELLSNPSRLLILCRLAEVGECPAGDLAMEGLSQSALSQHLARLRAEGLVETRREGRSIHYHIADERLLALMETLYQLYCKES